MATAPTPGSAARAKAADVAFRITVRGVTAIIRPADIGPRDDAMVRRATKAALGSPVSLLAAVQQLGDEDTIGLDVVCLLHWWALTRAGETTSTYAEALDAFPNLAEVDELVEMAEARSDDEEEGEGGDPLPPAEP